MTFGEYVKSERSAKGLTIKDVAKAINVSAVQLSNIENNKNKPNAITFGKLVKEFDLDKDKAFILLKEGKE